ncbi:hypothetical protein RUMHYD_03380 [Blautia hydrogenotrophica DSM 10507]|uniref:Uncharacterized protein n=1 Tax=Blautia hydrogenotrophica (strain DSM 10507 / JCM 14656 / S5a33) TaxID=476272 RepID=C0CR67_BLAHS|nr:hypothetical protein RUMHYD_03380 [Blautia hydrogenotrophica DSM 10507]
MKNKILCTNWYVLIWRCERNVNCILTNSTTECKMKTSKELKKMS